MVSVRGANTNSECSSDLFQYDDSAEVVDSSHNTGCFHFVPPVLISLFWITYRYCLLNEGIYALALFSEISIHTKSKAPGIAGRK